VRSPSLALRLTGLYACTNLFLLAVMAWSQYHALATDLAQEDDQLLLETLAAASRGGVPRDRVASGVSSLGPWVREIGTECQVMRGPSLPGGPPPECPARVSNDPVFRTWRSPEGRTWRILRAGTPDESGVLHEVLLDRWTDQQTLHHYRRELIIMLPLAFLLCGIGGYLVARGGLAPLQSLARRMEAIRLDSDHEPVRIPRAPTELAVVIQSFEAMVARIRSGHDRLTRFAAELAHEFRTPVHVMRQQTEVALLSDRSPEAYRDVLRSTLEELDDLRRLVEDTLLLARAEDPQAVIDRQTLALGAELRDVADYLEPSAAERGVGLAVVDPGAVVLTADRMLLRRALVNLVTNAIRHTPSGGRITLSGARQDGQVTVEVRDSGEGVPADILPHVFDRHVRASETKGDLPTKSGLGLSIVRGIMRLHGGTADIASAVGSGTRVSLHFPAPASEK
jgi:two-component system heavy metal sensor histidine kinase CusS